MAQDFCTPARTCAAGSNRLGIGIGAIELNPDQFAERRNDPIVGYGHRLRSH